MNRADATVEFPPKDIPLRDDVRVLGALLGEVLKEQGGDTLFTRVEAARLAARRRRAGEESAEAELVGLLGSLGPSEAMGVVRAFSAYFSLVNLAEKVHRLRRRRDYLRDETKLQPGSLEAVFRGLSEAGLDLAAVKQLLGRVRVVPVFTAHPTEAVRRTLLVKEQRIARALVDRIDPAALIPREEAAALARVKNEASISWQTEEHLSVRPTVADEVEHVLFYLIEVIYRVIPPFYEELAEALTRVYGEGAARDLPRPLIRFGSWVGGDMDGNPNVGPDTIQATLARHSELILKRYQAEVRQLFDHLSQSTTQISFDEEVLARTEAYREKMPEVFQKIPRRYHEMPYRLFLWLISARLERTERGESFAYRSPEEFGEDLALISESLAHHKGENAGRFRVERLRRRLETFGFHLATLDLRQDALVHRHVLAELLGISDFTEKSREERTSILEKALSREVPRPSGNLSEEAKKTLRVFEVAKAGRERYGKEALGPYIISMAQGPDDALAVLYLARAAGFVDAQGNVPLDISPLFETVADLDEAHHTLGSLLENPVYQKHLRARGQEQMVMLGYSDSNKESGIAASRFALYKAQRELLAKSASFGVDLTLFHGRGGTISRGGSKPRAAILAEPPGAVRGRLRMTEQGEIIHAKYGLRGIATRTLELTLGAVLEASAKPHEPPKEEWREAMKYLAEESRSAYRALVYEEPDFYAYFRDATPIDVIERMHIGSRPAARRAKRGIRDLRAIPWVFAWTQSRHILTGWYGAGTGLSRVAERYGLPLMQEMEKGWPFFQNFLADIEMVLAKADMPIAARYAQLARETGKKIYPRILEEFEKTRAILFQIKGESELLDSEPVLQRSIRLRNPYVDPMSFLQVDLLARWREKGRDDPALEKALFTTVQGIARGLQNTG